MHAHYAPNLILPGIAHGFFGRAGGVSTGLYESLNCGGVRDDPAHVAENRARVAAWLMPGARLATLSQIHSASVHVAGPDWDSSSHPPGDGLVTVTPGLALGILTADCAPVLFADAQAGVIGAAHAGWKGALGGVLDATLAAMETLGARRPRIVAAIGPCIGRTNYEVGPEFPGRFPPSARGFFTAAERAGHWHFDLAGYVASQLAGLAGVTALGLCTYPPENGFFSFRRTTHRGEADYGREISAIALAGERRVARAGGGR